MPLEIIQFELGPLANNTYLISDSLSNDAVVIDPGFNSHTVAKQARQRGWTIQAIWLTHAHFDHMAGIDDLIDELNYALPVGLHPDDLDLLQQGGGAALFGIVVKPAPKPALAFSDGQTLHVGSQTLVVMHTPGHTRGHVTFYSSDHGTAFCGDLIFYHGVGRTDMPGGNHNLLLNSIREKIMVLPPDTRLLSGHGPETTVEEERTNNPFL